MVGLYTIRNTRNGMFYIGSSKNIRKRILAHKASMKKGKHSNWKIRRDYKRYGAGSFQFDVMLQCPEANLRELEQAWLDMWVGDELCYNIADIADEPYNKGLKGKDNPMYGKTGALHPRFGIKHSQAVIDKQRKLINELWKDEEYRNAHKKPRITRPWTAARRAAQPKKFKRRKLK